MTLGVHTRALIALLRAGPRRPSPDPAILALVSPSTPDDLRSYLEAWAEHAPESPVVQDAWLAPPKPHGDAIVLGVYISGEPVLARVTSAADAQIVVVGEGGQPTVFAGFEPWLVYLTLRAGGRN